jgi:hypothetical protein
VRKGLRSIVILPPKHAIEPTGVQILAGNLCYRHSHWARVPAFA